MSDTSVEMQPELSKSIRGIADDSSIPGSGEAVAMRESSSRPGTGAGAPRRSRVREFFRYGVSAAILAGGFAICIGLSALKVPPKNQSTEQLIPLVDTAAVTSYAGQLDMEVSGTVVPFREIRVAAEVSGNVITKYPACEAGNFVTKGTTLLEIDPEDYKLQRDTREAELLQSQRMLAETQEELDGAQRSVELAERDYQIALAEFERNQRIKSALSSAELDQSKRNLLNVEAALTGSKNSLGLITARLERMKSAVELAKTQLERAVLNLSKSIIVAPVDGVIVSESIQEGEFVNPGSELLTFEDTSRSEVICNLTPRDLKWIRDNSPIDPDAAEKISENKLLSVYYLPKTSVSIFEPEKGGIVWEGVLERFDGIGRDNRTRTIPTRITISQPVVEQNGELHALVRGMYVKCRIEVNVSSSDQKRQFLTIPSIALRPGNYVWTVTPDRKLKRVDVQIVDRGEVTVEGEVERFVIIRQTEDSVQPGDEIVTSPIPQPKDDMEVELSTSKSGATKDDPARQDAGAPADIDPAA